MIIFGVILEYLSLLHEHIPSEVSFSFFSLLSKGTFKTGVTTNIHCYNWAVDWTIEIDQWEGEQICKKSVPITFVLKQNVCWSATPVSNRFVFKTFFDCSPLDVNFVVFHTHKIIRQKKADSVFVYSKELYNILYNKCKIVLFRLFFFSAITNSGVRFLSKHRIEI